MRFCGIIAFHESRYKITIILVIMVIGMGPYPVLVSLKWILSVDNIIKRLILITLRTCRNNDLSEKRPVGITTCRNINLSE